MISLPSNECDLLAHEEGHALMYNAHSCCVDNPSCIMICETAALMTKLFPTCVMTELVRV